MSKQMWKDSYERYVDKFEKKQKMFEKTGDTFLDPVMLKPQEFRATYYLYKDRFEDDIKSGLRKSMPNILDKIVNRQAYARTFKQAKQLAASIQNDPSLKEFLKITNEKVDARKIMRGQHNELIKSIIGFDSKAMKKQLLDAGWSEHDAVMATQEFITNKYFGGSSPRKKKK